MRALLEPLRDVLTRLDGTFMAGQQFNPRTTDQTFSLAMSDRWLRDVVSSLFSDESDEWQG